MEVSETRNLVRELDLTLQPRVVPRYKTWLPLATQQLRLRSLVQIIGHNLNSNNPSNETCWFYYTLHNTNMSSPLYTSETIDNPNPRWSSLEVPIVHATGYSTASEIILRLWKRTTMDETKTDITVFTWGISFSGLAYIGFKLPNNLDTMLKDNSLIFQFHGGFFTPAYCLITSPEFKRYLHIKINPIEVRDSYTVNKLSSLRSKMQALKQQTESVEALRMRIASGENIYTPKYQQSSLNRLFPPRKVNREKKAEILRIRKELEMARFRTKLLEQERVRKMGELRMLNQLHATITEENQDHGSNLMERYRELNKDIERLHEWRQNHLDTRETYIQLSSQLAHRRRQLISELSLIYPIIQDTEGKFRINSVHLPDSEDLELSNDTQVAVALGFVAHATQMIANFLNVPTRYPIIHYGSRSKIIDHITENLPDDERQFPLFARSKDKLQFRYAVYLLNKNIAQLRWYCGLPTADLRATLSNLSTLINIKPNQSNLDNSKRTFSTSSLDTDVGNGRHNVPLTPPIQKLIFEKCHRPSRSMSQLKTIKSTLGSSLDQGLDKPVQSLVLSSESKRICKSEESAIDNKALVLAQDRSNTSSNDTLNNAVLNNISSRSIEHESPPARDNPNSTVEGNIEIAIPTSVSKSVHLEDSLETSVSARDRSSNSISSCEMALSGSQNDADASFNGYNLIKREGTEECVPLLPDNGRIHKDAIDSLVKNGESSNDHKNGSEIPRDCDTTLSIDTTPGERNYRIEQQCSTANVSECQRERFAKSCLSLNDIITCTYDETENKDRSNSTSSHSEEYLSAKDIQSSNEHNAELKKTDTEHRAYPENWNRQDSEEESTLETEPLLGARKSDCYPYTEQQTKQCDFEASSEYIDIIRRSSENVYARTEALVNKKTSFKVMKPRL